jgi:hypothetical protein
MTGTSAPTNIAILHGELLHHEWFALTTRLLLAFTPFRARTKCGVRKDRLLRRGTGGQDAARCFAFLSVAGASTSERRRTAARRIRSEFPTTAIAGDGGSEARQGERTTRNHLISDAFAQRRRRVALSRAAVISDADPVATGYCNTGG